MDLSDEEVSVSPGDLGVSDVDHVLVDVEVNLGARLELPLEPRGALGPHHVLHLVLECEKVVPKLLCRSEQEKNVLYKAP